MTRARAWIANHRTTLTFVAFVGAAVLILFTTYRAQEAINRVKKVEPQIACIDNARCRAFIQREIRAAVKPLRIQLHLDRSLPPNQRRVVPSTRAPGGGGTQPSAPPSQPFGGGGPGPKPPGNPPNPPPPKPPPGPPPLCIRNPLLPVCVSGLPPIP